MGGFDWVLEGGTTLQAYSFDPFDFLWFCNKQSLPTWWSPDYLKNATFIGNDWLYNKQVRVYSNDKLVLYLC